LKVAIKKKEDVSDFFDTPSFGGMNCFWFIWTSAKWPKIMWVRN